MTLGTESIICVEKEGRAQVRTSTPLRDKSYTHGWAWCHHALADTDAAVKHASGSQAQSSVRPDTSQTHGGTATTQPAMKQQQVPRTGDGGMPQDRQAGWTAHPLGRPEVGRVADGGPRLVFDRAALAAQLLRRHQPRRVEARHNHRVGSSRRKQERRSEHRAARRRALSGHDRAGRPHHRCAHRRRRRHVSRRAGRAHKAEGESHESRSISAFGGLHQ